MPRAKGDAERPCVEVSSHTLTTAHGQHPSEMQCASDTAKHDRHDRSVYSAWSTTVAVAEEDENGPPPPSSSLSVPPWWKRPCRRDIEEECRVFARD
jgi:hypothetical protein